MRRRMMIVALACGLLAVNLEGAYDPLAGTWVLDVEHSKFAAGYPAPKSQIFHIEAVGDNGIKFSADTVETDGTKIHIEYAAQMDGNESPVKGAPNADTVSLTRPRPHTRAGVWKKNGQITGTFDVVLWGSALLMTITSKEIRNGQTFENVAYYHKQLPQ